MTSCVAMLAWLQPITPGLAPGRHSAALLIGVLVTVAAFALGVSYWLWRRGRGEVRRADDDVLALSNDPTGRSAREPIGGPRSESAVRSPDSTRAGSPVSGPPGGPGDPAMGRQP